MHSTTATSPCLISIGYDVLRGELCSVCRPWRSAALVLTKVQLCFAAFQAIVVGGGGHGESLEHTQAHKCFDSFKGGKLRRPFT